MSAADVRLRAEIPCESCKGKGTVYDPAGFGWADLVKLDDDAFEAVLHDRGYINGKSVDGERPLPPEEGPCTECDGSGWAGKLLTLGELAALLGQESGR